MNMKLSYRDKVVFIVVIVILILVAGFFLLIKPKFEEIDQAKYNLERVQAERDQIDERIATLPTLIENMKATARDIGEKQDIFMTEMAPYQNEEYIKEVLSSANIEYGTFNTSYTSSSSIDRYTVSPANILVYPNKMTADIYDELPQEVIDRNNGVSAPSYPNTVIGVTNVNIAFKTDQALRKAYSVIDSIARNDKTIIINSISFTKDENAVASEEATITCSMTVYSINPLNVEKVLEETDEIKPIETPAE